MIAEAQELELAPTQEGEAPMKQLAPYDEFKTKVEAIKATAETITVTDSSQVAQMKIARTTRLELRAIRVAVEHRHKELKEHILVEGRKIDAGKNEIFAIIAPLELRLKEQEEFITLEEGRKAAERKAAREAALAPYLIRPLAFDVSVLSEERFAEELQAAKDAHEMRLLREKHEALRVTRAYELAPLVRFIKSKLPDLGEISDEDYVALIKDARDAEKADAEERERQRVENERLRKEAAEKEAALKKEREEREAERIRLEKKRQKAIAEERKKREAEHLKQQAERQAAEAEARKERERLAEAARIEREAREKLELEARQRKAREEKAEAARLAAIEAAALAPDKEKLLEYARAVRALPWPQMTTIKGKAASRSLVEYTDQFTTFIEGLAQRL